MATSRSARTCRPARRARTTAVSDDRGVTAIELAFIAPSLLLLIFLIVQVALYLYGRSVALQAAREGVSQLRLLQKPGLCNRQKPIVKDAIVRFSHSVGSGALTGVSVTPECKFAGDGPTYANSTVSVRVEGQSISLVGISLPITQTATGRVEQFQNDG